MEPKTAMERILEALNQLDEQERALAIEQLKKDIEDMYRRNTFKVIVGGKSKPAKPQSQQTK